jgi:site-specific recombinase XerD
MTNPGSGTLASYIEPFLQSKAGMTVVSVRNYRSTLLRLSRMYPTLVLTDFERPAGDDLVISFLSVDGRAPRTTQREWSVLREFFKWCVINDHLNTNAMTVIVLPPATSRRQPRTIPEHDRLRILDAARDDRERLVFRLYWTLGVAVVEAIRIRVGDYNTRTRLLTLHDGRGRSRAIEVTDTAIKRDLEAWVNERIALRSQPATLAETTRVKAEFLYHPVGRPDKGYNHSGPRSAG